VAIPQGTNHDPQNGDLKALIRKKVARNGSRRTGPSLNQIGETYLLFVSNPPCRFFQLDHGPMDAGVDKQFNPVRAPNYFLVPSIAGITAANWPKVQLGGNLQGGLQITSK